MSTTERAALMTTKPASHNRKSSRKYLHGRPRLWVYAVLTVALGATVIPFVWMFLGSFKTQKELVQRPLTWWPEMPTLDNYTTWIGELNFIQFFANSVLVAAFTVLGNLLFCSMVGYALAKMEFIGKRVLFSLVMLMLMVPGTVTFVPLFVLVANMGMLNTYAGLILPFLTAPIGVFLMRQFMLGIPDSLIEAARIDGAGEMRIFLRIVLPLCGAPLATLGILTFLGSWNNFLWPLVAAQTADKYTLPIALTLFSSGPYGTSYGILLAGAVLVITPIVILFIALQKHFTQGIATIGLK